MENILEIRYLSKKYSGFALEEINLNLKKGYITGLIGPNGAGKTTIIKLLMNLIKRDRGEIQIFGLDNIKFEKEIKQRIGFVYDENYFYEELTLQDIKRIVKPYYRHWDDRVYEKLMKQFQLPGKKKIKELSKGMKMKFSLALALSHQAELLIMDEPTSGLDPVFRNELLDILYEYMAEENRGILFSTHIISDLDKIADYITLIDQGKIVVSCSKEELQEKYILVKGEKKYLDEQLRQELIGLKESQYGGFEGLTTEKDKISSLYKDLILERPTLEEILLFTVRGRENCSS